MRVAVLGAGPAGLYFAYRLKRARPDIAIEIFEQNPRGATFGFGLAFSGRALEFLREQDAQTYAALAPALQSWTDSILDLNGTEIRIDGMTYTGIGRLALLAILEAQARSVGIEPRYDHRISSFPSWNRTREGQRPGQHVRVSERKQPVVRGRSKVRDGVRTRGKHVGRVLDRPEVGRGAGHNPDRSRLPPGIRDSP